MKRWYTCLPDGGKPQGENKAGQPVPARINRPRSKARPKGGALTRPERTRMLRRRPGYGGIQLVPGGIVITCRQTDGFVNLAEIFAAEADARGGKPKRLNDWMRLKTTAGYLEAVGLDAGIPASNLIEMGSGSTDPWAHHEVACEIAAWLSPQLRLAINRLWLETVNSNPKRRPPADPALLTTRRKAQRPLTDVLQAMGMDGVGIQRCQRQLVYELTGKTPSTWKKQLGPNWMDQMPDGFQTGMALLRRMAALECSQLNLEEAEGFFRHFNAAFRRAAAPVKSLMPVMGDLPEPLAHALQGAG